MSRHLHCSLGEAQGHPDVVVRFGPVIPFQHRSQTIEELTLAGLNRLTLEPGKDQPKQVEGPPPLEEPIGRQVMGRLAPYRPSAAGKSMEMTS